MIKILSEPIILLGQVEFQVKNGTIRVNGQVFDSSNSFGTWNLICSPKSTALLVIEPENEAEIEFRPVDNGLEEIQMCQPIFSNLFSPDSDSLNQFEELVRGCFVMKSEIYPVLRIGEEWKSALMNVSSSSSSTKDSKRIIFVCGHRKVGKSSFSRYLINGLLNEFEEVDFIDLDLGQTEFTPPGFITRKTLKRDEALLGPPFSHLKVPDDGIYLASSNGSEMPLLYCRAIHAMAKNLNDSMRPVVINTMGWMTGLGLEFIQFALQTFKPSHVFAFMAPESQDLIKKCLTGTSTSTGLGLGGMVSALSEVEADSVNIRYMGNPVGEGARGKYSPADQRNLAYWSYFFGKISPTSGSMEKYNFTQLSSLKPVVVPLSHVQLACTSREINLFDLIKSREGCDHVRLLESWLLMRVVGLARDDKFEKIPGRWVNLVSNGKIGKIVGMPSVGLGLVRSIVRISDSRIHLHILTPLPLNILSTTNTLILGSQQLPLPMISSDSSSLQAESPGFSTQMVGTDVNGSSARKTRHNMRRR